MAAGSNQKRISAYATPLARVDVDVGGGWCEYVCAMFMCCKMDVYFVLFFVRASPLRTLKALFYCSGFFVVLFFRRAKNTFAFAYNVQNESSFVYVFA